MASEFLLILQDDELRLFSETLDESPLIFKKSSDSLKQIEGILRSFSKSHLSLLMDRGKKDIHEEMIPPLFFWDKFLFLLRKRADFMEKGGFGGFEFLREEEGTFFRTIHIPPEDFLAFLLEWAENLSNPFRGVFITSLEVKRFFKEQGKGCQKYTLFLYPLTSSKARYLVLKGGRLLAIQDWRGTSELKATLHFLSRRHPDIHEEIQGISLLNEEINTTLSIIKLHDPTRFYRFILTQKRPLITVRTLANEDNILRRYGERILVCLAGVLILYWSTQGVLIWREAREQRTPIEALRNKTRALKASLTGQNVNVLRLLWDRYHALDQRRRSPFSSFKKLENLLTQQHLHLMDLEWFQDKDVKMLISCFMKDAPYDELSLAVEDFVSALKHHFPKAVVELIEAPFHSSPSETFTSSQESAHPLLRLKMRF